MTGKTGGSVCWIALCQVSYVPLTCKACTGFIIALHAWAPLAPAARQQRHERPGGALLSFVRRIPPEVISTFNLMNTCIARALHGDWFTARAHHRHAGFQRPRAAVIPPFLTENPHLPLPLLRKLQNVLNFFSLIRTSNLVTNLSLSTRTRKFCIAASISIPSCLGVVTLRVRPSPLHLQTTPPLFLSTSTLPLIHPINQINGPIAF